jgi:hypothetical protein
MAYLEVVDDDDDDDDDDDIYVIIHITVLYLLMKLNLLTQIGIFSSSYLSHLQRNIAFIL